MFCTSCGTQAAPGSAFCVKCGKPLAATTAAPAASQGVISLEKPSPVSQPSLQPASQPPVLPAGMDDIPPGVKGWSWGAFLLNWIWAIGNRTWIGLLAMIPYVGFGVAIWLGIKGREMAWKARDWDSVEHFNRVQRRWSQWAVGILIGSFLLGIVAAIAIPAYHSYAQRAKGGNDAELQAAFDEAMDARPDTPATPDAPEAPTPPAASANATRTESGKLDSNSDSLPGLVVTSAGTLSRKENADGTRYVALDGHPLFNGDDAPWQFPMRSFSLSNGRQAVLMASSGGRGNSCETLFFFLLVEGSSLRTTPLFGTCSAQGSYAQAGDEITLTLPQMGGMSTVVLRDGAVIEDGKTLVLDNTNDPSQ